VKEKEKIVTICSTSFHEYDRRLIRISKALRHNGYSIIWFSRTTKPQARFNDDINHQIIKTLFKTGILFYSEYNLRLFFKLLFLDTDYINAIDLDTIPATSFANIFKRKILTFDAHEIFYEVPELVDKPIKKSIWKMIAKICLPNIKHNYTVNNSLQNHYSEKYFTSYSVIRNVPNLSKGSSVKSNNKKLVYLGVLNKGRGLEIAIEAMKKLPEYSLTLVGEGDLSEQLKLQAKNLNNVEFLGYTDPAKLNSILQDCSIGLNMLMAQSLNYKLSLANKFFDYMHAGIPSINMAYPEYASVLKLHETGVMVQEYTVEALLKAVSILEKNSVYQQLSENALQYKELYSWESEQKKLISFYGQLRKN